MLMHVMLRGAYLDILALITTYCCFLPHAIAALIDAAWDTAVPITAKLEPSSYAGEVPLLGLTTRSCFDAAVVRSKLLDRNDGKVMSFKLCLPAAPPMLRVCSSMCSIC